MADRFGIVRSPSMSGPRSTGGSVRAWSASERLAGLRPIGAPGLAISRGSAFSHASVSFPASRHDLQRATGHGEAFDGMLVIKMGALWAPARSFDGVPDMLASPFGHTPVVTRRHEQAMHLALYCGACGPEDLGYIWLRPCHG